MSAHRTGAGRALWWSVVAAAAAAVALGFTVGGRAGSTLALGLNLAAVTAFLSGISRAMTGNALGFALNGLNRYSLARAQMGIWTVMVATLLLTVAEHNLLVAGGSDAMGVAVPGALLAALGISFASGAAAPAIVSLRGETSPQATAVQLDAAEARNRALTGKDAPLVASGQMVGNAVEAGASWMDMFTGDDVAIAGRVDISKVQQALLTVIVVGTYMGSAVGLFRDGSRIPALPDFSESAAQLLAVSHAGYLIYKAVPKPDATRAASRTIRTDQAPV